MAKSDFKTIKLTPTEEIRPIDAYFKRLNDSHQNPANRLLHFICVPLMVFGLFGLAWAMPFPHIKFLGSYNMYFNWASFFIAFAVYFYLKLSPTLSYLFLFVLMILSYGIMKLAAWEQSGGIPLWMFSAVLLLFALGGQYIGNKTEGKKRSLKDDAILALISPLWMLHFLTKKIGVRY